MELADLYQGLGQSLVEARRLEDLRVVMDTIEKKVRADNAWVDNPNFLQASARQ